MLTTMLHPELVTKLVLWNIVGGVYGTYVLGAHYVLPSIQAVRSLGVEGLLSVPEWQERIADNPANRERLLGEDADQFLKVMLRWLNAFVVKPGQTIPGVDDEWFDRITVPTLIIRGGEDDWNHPKRTSLEVGLLDPGVRSHRPTLARGCVGTRFAGQGAGKGEAVQHVRHVGAGGAGDSRVPRPLNRLAPPLRQPVSSPRRPGRSGRRCQRPPRGRRTGTAGGWRPVARRLRPVPSSSRIRTRADSSGSCSKPFCQSGLSNPGWNTASPANVSASPPDSTRTMLWPGV